MLNDPMDNLYWNVKILVLEPYVPGTAAYFLMIQIIANKVLCFSF